MKYLIPFLLFFVSIHSFSYINCGMFCVQSIEFDSSGVLQANVLFEADSELFINYPYVSAVIDLQGDTIATGTLNFFGQFSNSTQEYSLETDLLPPFDSNFEGFVLFNYDTLFCELYYPCEPSGLTKFNSGVSHWIVYPNPAINQINVKFSGFYGEKLLAEIIQTDGRVVYKSVHEAKNKVIDIDLSALKGLYYIRLRDLKNSQILFGQRIIINN